MLRAGPSQPDRTLAGILMVVAALFLFALQDVVIKSFAERYSVLQIVFVRGAVALVPMLAVALIANRGRLAVARPGPLLLRGLFGFCSYLGYYMAIAALPLAEVVTIVFTAPVFATVLSALLLGEVVGARRWAAVGVGFAAAALVAGPAGSLAALGVALALAAALTYAAQSLMTRYIGDAAPPSLISFYGMLVFVAGSVCASLVVWLLPATLVTDDPSLAFLLRAWVWPAPGDLALMIALGINAAAGFFLLAKAYHVAPVSSVAPFEYTFVLWAVLFGYLFWAEVPAANTVAGLTLLIGSSLYILHRELRLARAGRATTRAGARTVLPAQSAVRAETAVAPAPGVVQPRGDTLAASQVDTGSPAA